jgi:hypothetical protein
MHNISEIKLIYLENSFKLLPFLNMILTMTKCELESYIVEKNIKEVG